MAFHRALRTVLLSKCCQHLYEALPTAQVTQSHAHMHMHILIHSSWQLVTAKIITQQLISLLQLVHTI